jgi:hypothetical protein
MTGREEQRARWTEIVGRFRQSGMTKSAFAQREGLRITDLKNWHFRLPNADKAALNSTRGQTEKAETATAAKQKSAGIKPSPLRMLPVTVQTMQDAKGRAGQVVIDVRALQIVVGGDADAVSVAQLVAAIRKHAC